MLTDTDGIPQDLSELQVSDVHKKNEKTSKRLFCILSHHFQFWYNCEGKHDVYGQFKVFSLWIISK